MVTALPRRSPHVRPSTDTDLATIYAWLQEQDRNEVHGTFLCNWSLTMRCHEEDRLQVYIDPATQEPVAYQWGGLVRPGILEVRDNMRGRGIGKELVEHCLALASEAGEHILYIQCKPSTSIPFWERMGFELLAGGEHRENYAVRLMQQQFEVPDDGQPVEVVVDWFSEQRKWAPSTPPAMSQTIRGVLHEGEVFLAERALCFGGLVERDAVLRVTVDGQEWYCDKAKYKEAELLGLERCRNGYYIDVLYPPEDRS